MTDSATRRTLDEFTALSVVLAIDEARRVIEREAPDLLSSSLATQFAAFPVGGLLRLVLSLDPTVTNRIVAALATVEDTAPRRPEAPAIRPDPRYEPASTERASALVGVPVRAEQYCLAEVMLTGPSHGNPFVDVELTAEFRLGDLRVRVGGFYDGGSRYCIRFLPAATGTWTFVTSSNARSLDGVTGRLQVRAGDGRGPVRVADRFHFAAADGSSFRPVGTTAYAWLHQHEDLQAQTLQSLAGSPFNKLRMCLFPKDFLYNTNEPERFVFPRAAGGGWDTTRFDVGFFVHLERRINDLAAIGIEAELILFHPYDRWGFADLGTAADDRYVRYVVRRLAAFPNVWWSMANEYDLLINKRPEDWHRLGDLVRQEDHVGHPRSIHNWGSPFDHSAAWVTHGSFQNGEDLAAKITRWRQRWDKPVMVDEFGYEGDLDQGWGNLTPQEVVRRAWLIALRGGYFTHGETYWSDDEVIFWSKGGALRGESIPRIEFLSKIASDAPAGRFEPVSTDWDAVSGGAEGHHIVMYFGSAQPRFRNVTIPNGMSAQVDVIDTWNMTIEERPGIHQETLRVELPARPYMAVRLRAQSDQDAA